MIVKSISTGFNCSSLGYGSESSIKRIKQTFFYALKLLPLSFYLRKRGLKPNYFGLTLIVIVVTELKTRSDHRSNKKREIPPRT